MKLRYAVLVIFITSLLGTNGVKAQENQLIPLNQNVYEYIKDFQKRGEMLQLNPTSLPYTKGEVQKALKSIDKEELSSHELKWYSHIERVLNIGEAERENNKELYVHGMLGGGFHLNNTQRLDGLRPSSEDPYFLPNGELQLYAEGGNFGGQLGLRHDLQYYHDPDGILPYGRLYVRSEDFYFGYQGDYLKIYYGRFNNHWGMYNEASAILSDNPNSYDNISFTFGNDKLSVQGVFGELDNLGTNGEFGQGGRVNGDRRFLAVHRINWRPNYHMQLSLIKADVYSSSNASVSFKYFNPFNDLFFDRTGDPVNDDSNSFVGGFLWFNKNNFTLNGQAILDDVHVTDNNEQITFTISGAAHIAEIIKRMDIGVEAELVSYQSYNTSTSVSTRYVYLKKGLATPFNDYVMTSIFGRLYAYELLDGLIIESRFTALFQGEQEINQPFYKFKPDGSLPDVVLTGTVEQTLRSAIGIKYNPIPEFWVNAELGVNTVQNKSNILNNSENRITGNIEVGFRLSLDGAIGN